MTDSSSAVSTARYEPCALEDCEKAEEDEEKREEEASNGGCFEDTSISTEWTYGAEREDEIAAADALDNSDDADVNAAGYTVRAYMPCSVLSRRTRGLLPDDFVCPCAAQARGAPREEEGDEDGEEEEEESG